MRRQLTALFLTAALAPALAACNGDGSPSADATTASSAPSTPSSSSTTSAASCDTMLSQDEAETAAGTTLSDPRSAGQSEIEACQWSGKDSGVQALKAPADQWVQQLPAVLQQYQASGVKIPSPVQAKIAQGLKLVQEKKTLSGDQACSLFAELTKIPGQAGPDGTLDTVLPSEQKPQGVTAQACTEGTYWSVTVAYKTLSKNEVPGLTQRADDALATLTS